MLKKRLLAWLLVMCMTVSLLPPGTAWAADADAADGKATITYDLNDNKLSSYKLQLKTEPGHEPDNSPGAYWAGRPFLGWAKDRGGQQPVKAESEYVDGLTLFAQWGDGDLVTFHFEGSPTSTTVNLEPRDYTTGTNGLLPDYAQTEIADLIQNFVDGGTHSFGGWYTDVNYRNKIELTDKMPGNGTHIYAKWEVTYRVTFNYNNGSNTKGIVIDEDPASKHTFSATPNVERNTSAGGTLAADNIPEEPKFRDDLYKFDGWYIIKPLEGNVILRKAVDITEGILSKPENVPGATPAGIAAAGGIVEGIKIDNLATFSFKNASEDLGTTNITVVANWKAPYGVVFDANGGDFGSASDIKRTLPTTADGRLTDRPPIPERTGYLFLGWFFENPNSGDDDVYPDLKDSTGETILPNTTSGFSASEYNPSKISGNPTGKALTPQHEFTGAAYLKAKWEKMVTVYIDYPHGGQKDVTLYARYGEQFGKSRYEQYLKNIVVPGYKVLSTYKVFPTKEEEPEDKDLPKEPADPTDPSDNIKAENEIQMYPFKKDTTIKIRVNPGYSIRFDPTDGEFKSPDEKGYRRTNTQGLLPLSDPLPELKSDYNGTDNRVTWGGKTFLGWFDESGKQIKVEEIDEVDGYIFSGDTTLYAHWGAPYRIKYNLGTNEHFITDPTTDQEWTSKEDNKYPGGTNHPATKLPEVRYNTNSTSTESTRHFIGWTRNNNSIDENDVIKKEDTAPEHVVDLFPFWLPWKVTFYSNASGGINFADHYGEPSLIVKADEDGKLSPPAMTVTNGSSENCRWRIRNTTTLLTAAQVSSKIFTEDTEFVVELVTTNSLSQSPLSLDLASLLNDKATASTMDVGPVTHDENEENEGPIIPGDDNDDTLYTIIFKANGGAFAQGTSGVSADGLTCTVDVGEDEFTSFTPPEVTLKYQTFDGWYIADATGNPEGTALTFNEAFFQTESNFTSGSVTVVAKWKPVKVTFNANGGKFDDNDETKDETVNSTTGLVTPPTATLTRTDYTFSNKWSYEDGSVEENLSTKPFENDTTLYAVWEVDSTTHPNAHMITFNANGGKFTDGAVMSTVLTTTAANGSDQEANEPTLALERDGYKFGGWSKTKNDANDKVTDWPEKFDDDTILYAIWEPIKVTLDPGTGSWDGVTLTAGKYVSEIANGKLKTPPATLPTFTDHILTEWKGGTPEITVKPNELAGYEFTGNVDITLTAQWRQAYKITLNLNYTGAPTVTALKIGADGKLADSVPTNPTRDSEGNKTYTFDDWYTTADGNVKFDWTQTFNSDTTAYAHWTESTTTPPTGGTYTITFDANEGTGGPTTATTGTDGKLAALPSTEPTRENYTFDGWYKAATGNDKVTTETTFTENSNVYAHWNAVVTLDPNGGILASTGVVNNDKLQLVNGKVSGSYANPTRTDYEFQYWLSSSGGGPVTLTPGAEYNTPGTLTAQWTAKAAENPGSITLHTLNRQNPSATTTQILNTNDGNYTLTAPLPVEGYSFEGWYLSPSADGYTAGWKPDNTFTKLFPVNPPINKIDNGSHVFAYWIQEYKITFNFNDGNTDNDWKYTENGKVTAPTPPRYPGHEFVSWATASGAPHVDGVTPYRENTTLYAEWKPVIYTITFNAKEADTPIEGLVRKTEDGKVKDFPKPTKTGYTLDYWSGDDGKKYNEGDEFTGNVTLTAHWVPKSTAAKTPVVTFYVDIPTVVKDTQENVAHFTMVTDRVVIGGTVGSQPVNRLSQLPTLIDVAEANGWRRKDGDQYFPVNEGTSYSIDTDLYVSQSSQIAVTFDWMNGNPDTGEPSEKSTIMTDDDGYIELNRWPTEDEIAKRRPGCTFEGWYTATVGGNKVSMTAPFTASDNIVYARWNSPYKITFNANGGKWTDSNGKETEEIEIWTDVGGNLSQDAMLMAMPSDPKKDGYGTFMGWALSKTAAIEEVMNPVTGEGTQPYTKPVTYYAVWGPPYEIKYELVLEDAKMDELTDIQKQTTSDGKIPESLPEPTHSRDTFTGWYLTKDYSGEPVKPGDTCTSAVTLYAKWERIAPYTVTFNPTYGYMNQRDMEADKDGTKHPTLSLRTDKDGVLMNPPSDPIMRGGNFLGWYTAEEPGTGEKVTDLATHVFKDDDTLYAHWDNLEFTITFNFNLQARPGMTEPFEVTTTARTQERKLAYLPNLKLPQAASEEYEVEAWYRVPNPGPEDKPVDKANDEFYRDTTLYAQWKKAEKIPVDFLYANITFMDDKDKPMVTIEVGINNKMERYPEPPYKDGNKFIGWVTRDPDGTEHQLSDGTKPVDPDQLITGSIIAYPKYRWSTAVVTFDPGLGDVSPKTANTSKDGTLTEAQMPIPTWAGHTFLGWFTREDEEGVEINKRTVFTEDTTVYAHWKDGEPTPPVPDDGYLITFDPNGGTVKYTSLRTGKDGKLQYYPEPAREGYTFNGWYHGDEKVNEETKVYTEDTKLIAHWQKLPDEAENPTSPPYTITFNADGGNVSKKTDITDLYGKLETLPTPTKTGYKFDGWYKDSERVTTATVFTSNTTVIAHWSTYGQSGSSGDGSGSNEGYSITVSATEGGRVTASKTYAQANDRITMTVRPNTGYMIESVYVTNSRGRDVELYDQGGSRYTFYMPDSRVTIEATFVALTVSDVSAGISGNLGNLGNIGTNGNTSGTTGSTSGTTNWLPGGVSGTSNDGTTGLGVFSAPVLNTLPMPYADVRPSDWYYGSVDYLWKRSLMGGVSATQFGPNATTSNAMIWTILARLAGVDVTAGASVWYENARSWAVSNNISDGAEPNAPVTREQLASMLWRYKGSPATGYDLGQFSDRGLISTYQAESALRWAASNNIVTGSNGRLNPRGTATRAEVAAMITRFCQNT